MDGDAGPVLARNQRTPAVGKGFGQHWHHLVGKIGRIAAPVGVPVQGVAGAHVPGDVGDGDQQMPATGIFLVRVRLRPHRVVEIAGVGAVDGDQRQGAKIVTVFCRRRAGSGGLLFRLGRKTGWQVVIDQGDNRR